MLHQLPLHPAHREIADSFYKADGRVIKFLRQMWNLKVSPTGDAFQTKLLNKLKCSAGNNL
jgi:hypothetical protein